LKILEEEKIVFENDPLIGFQAALQFHASTDKKFVQQIQLLNYKQQNVLAQISKNPDLSDKEINEFFAQELQFVYLPQDDVNT